MALDTKTSAVLVPYVFMDKWPNPLYPTAGASDPPFIAPFYAEADFRIGRLPEPSRLSYRILDPSTTSSQNQIRIMEGMLEHVSQFVRDAVIGADHFLAQKGIVITWYDVTFQSSDCVTQPEDNCRVSIQCVIK